jgi:hypothetical protein
MFTITHSGRAIGPTVQAVRLQRRFRWLEKQNPSAGFRQISVVVSGTENKISQCRFPSLQAIVRKPSLPLYLGVLGHSLALGCPHTHCRHGTTRSLARCRDTGDRLFLAWRAIAPAAAFVMARHSSVGLALPTGL